MIEDTERELRHQTDRLEGIDSTRDNCVFLQKRDNYEDIHIRYQYMKEYASDQSRISVADLS